MEALDFLFAQGAHAARAHEPLPRSVLLDLKLPKVDDIEVLARIWVMSAPNIYKWWR